MLCCQPDPRWLRPTLGAVAAPTRQDKVPQALSLVYHLVTDLTDSVCQQHLTDEYAALARGMTAALCRKRPSPLSNGNLNVWACAIVHALGRVNFLFDHAQTPHLTAPELAQLFGVAKSTVSAKASVINRLFRISLFDPRWTLPSRVADNPLTWLVEIDGFIVDVRTLPLTIQQAAVRQGAIPYLP